MIRKILLIGLVGALLLCGTAHAELGNRAPVVSNVTASQRGDGSKLVEIHYDLSDADGDACTVSVTLSDDGGATWDVWATSLSGHIGEGVVPGIRRQIVWHVEADQPGLVGESFKARVCAHDGRLTLPPAPMCFVSAGQFMTSTGVWVDMSAYYIDKYEVTNELYCQFLNSGGNDDHWHSSPFSPPYEQQIIKHGPGSYSVAAGKDRRPVGHVNWYDAVAFCDWRATSEGLPAGTYHLPTEAQWEKAAGWDPVEQKLWTYAIQSDTIDCTRVNFAVDHHPCAGHTTDVGSYPHTSYYGCYDMSGNVWEWCADREGSYPSGTSDPTGPGSGSERVLRGGGWVHERYSCRVSGRYGLSPTSWPGHDGGFRCARTQEPEGCADSEGFEITAVHALNVTTSGSGPGTVELSPPGGIYDDGTTVTLTARPSPPSFFDHWEGDLSGSANPVTILMADHKTVVAHFIHPQLTVLSAPIVDVAITGTRAGTTPYTADCVLHEVVALTAPESVSVGGKSYYFAYWSVDNVPVPPSEGFNEVEVTMGDRRTAVAQYDWRLPGDFNDDCVVNILDLLYVRNRLQTKCSE